MSQEGSAKRRSGSDASPSTGSGIPLALWILGLLFLLAAVAFSGLLALKQLGFIGDNLPGCGPKSACGALTSGPFGRIPGIGWPVSYVGLAWFLGLLVAWLLARRGLQDLLVWLIRLGALASLGFVLIMVSKGEICPYCLGAHVGNFGFWIIVELTRRSPDQSNATVGGVVVFMLATIMLAGAQVVQTSNKAARADKEEDLLVQQVLAEATENVEPTPAADPTGTPKTATEQPGEKPAPSAPAQHADEAVERDLLAARWLLGDEGAPVHVVMFSDYSCPDCRTFEDEMQRVLERRGDVSLSVKHFPMCMDCNDHLSKTLHSNACWAARSAEAAGILGGEEAFWEMHRWLFANRGAFPGGYLPPIVEELGFDPIVFQETMMSEETLNDVKADIEDGVELGLYFTPMIFVNGVQVKWQLLGTNLTRTVDRIAEAIAEGRIESTRSTPPTGIDRLVADWRDGRRKTLRSSNREFRQSGSNQNAPRVTAFVDFVSPRTAQFIDQLHAWEKEHGATNLVFRVNPLNHDCNPNLPDAFKSRAGSCMAARALYAAGIVGDDQSFYNMAWWLIENGPSLGSMDQERLVEQASTFGLDPNQFQSAMYSAGVDQLINQDLAEFKRNRFRSVPSVMVDGRLIPRMDSDASILHLVLDEVSDRSSP
jgi:protein-disulfide isomerase/uncharacterized membrane protein